MILENSDTYSVTCSCRRLLVFVLAMALVFGALCVGGVSGASWTENVASKWSGGSGTLNDPYEISSGEELALLAQNVNAGNSYSGTYFELTADIDLGGKTWAPIGYATVSDIKTNNQQGISYSSYNRPFSGTLIGGGHSISNLTIVSNGYKTVGLFGYIAGGRIEHLHFDGEIMIADREGYDNDVKASCYLTISEKDIVGSLVGLLHDGVVVECSVLENGVYVSIMGSQGNSKYVIGGLIGHIIDSNKKTVDEDFGKYVSECSVIVANTEFNKGMGMIIGYPKIG